MYLSDSWLQWQMIRKDPSTIQSLPAPSNKIALEALKLVNKVYSGPTEEMLYEMVAHGGVIELHPSQLSRELLWIQYLHSWWQQGFLSIDYSLLERWFASEVQVLEERFENFPSQHRSFIINWTEEEVSYRVYRHLVAQQPTFKWFSPYHALELVESSVDRETNTR